MIKSNTGLNKSSKQLGIKGNFLNLINVICEKPTANIILNEKQSFPFAIRNKKPLLFNSVLEVPASALRKEKEIK